MAMRSAPALKAAAREQLLPRARKCIKRWPVVAPPAISPAGPFRAAAHADRGFIGGGAFRGGRGGGGGVGRSRCAPPPPRGSVCASRRTFARRAGRRGMGAGGGSVGAADRRGDVRRQAEGGSSQDDDDDEEEEEESDSVYMILTGEPRRRSGEDEYREEGARFGLPRTIDGWKDVFRRTWRMYRSTWVDEELEKKGEEGPPSKDAEDRGGGFDVGDVDVDAIQKKRDEIRKEAVDNFGRNLNTLHRDGSELLETVKEKTGIQTKEDLRRWAGEQMKLATECLAEFMKGYRDGRDDEIDKMINVYFKEFDKDQGAGSEVKRDAEADSESGEESETPKKRRRRRKGRRNDAMKRFRF